MKKYILTLILGICLSNISVSQCNQYQVYESFGTNIIPTQGGTWTQNSMVSSPNNPRTGLRDLAFNGVGDWIQTPLLNNVNTLSFWYRRSTNTTAWSCVIETSPDNITWTSRGTITTITTTYQQYILNLNSLGLNSVYVRVRDTRASGAQERYIDDMSWISNNSINNTAIPITGNCTQTVGTSILNVFDQGGLNDSYNNNLNQIVTFSPVDNTKKLELTFTFFNLENSAGSYYDTLIIYDGSSVTSPLIGKYVGSSIPSIISSSSTGELTLRFITDASNLTGTWGYQATIQMITPLPITLISLTAQKRDNCNLIEWSTDSEIENDYFILERSTDGINWNTIDKTTGAGNSNSLINYSFMDYKFENTINYYRLTQVDYNGVFEKFNNIVYTDNKIKSKKMVAVINTIGQEVPIDTKGLLIITYEDGSSIRIMN